MRRRVSFRAGLLWVMGVGLLGFVCAAGLALLGIQVSPVVTAALGMSSIWAPTALCWTAFYRVRLRRPEVLLAGALVARWGGEEFFVALPGADATTGLTWMSSRARPAAQTNPSSPTPITHKSPVRKLTRLRIGTSHPQSAAMRVFAAYDVGGGVSAPMRVCPS